MSQDLSISIQKQIQKNQESLVRDLTSLARQIELSGANAKNLFSQFAAHDNSIDAHRIREIVLDVINENLLKNAAFELDTDEDGFPDDWTLHNELGSEAICDFDETKHKYGTGSLRMFADNSLFASKDIYVTQELVIPWAENGIYTVAFYYSNHHAYTETFDFIARVRIYSSDGELLQTSTYEDGTISPIDDYIQESGFRRSYFNFMMPENAYKLCLDLGIRVAPFGVARVWFDYPTLQMGIVPTQRSPIVEGIIS